MAGFLYFRAGDTRPITRDLIAKYGLGYAFTGGLTNRPTSSTSPSGTPGLVFADASRQEGQDVGYHPDRQTWRKLPPVEGRPELWVGYWNDAKPGPVDAARPKQLRGVPVTLADGHDWEIPIVRSFDGAEQGWKSELPSAWVCDESGGLLPGTMPKAAYAHLWDLTTPIADAMLSIAAGEADEMPEAAAVGRAVVALLATNYTLSAAEIELLEIISTDEAHGVVLVATRYDTLLNWMAQKKTCDQSTVSGATLLDGAAA